MDDFIGKLEDYLKNNTVSKKRNIGHVNILDDQGNYLIDDNGKLSRLEKPNFSKDNDHQQIEHTFHYLRNKLLNLHTSRTNNYFDNYPSENIKNDQERLKESIRLLNKIKEEEDLKNKEILDMSKETQSLEIELIKLYNTTNFGEKEEIKKYLQLKMKVEEHRQKEKLLKTKLAKKVTIRDFKISDIDVIKIEYLNTKKSILKSNRIKLIPSKKTSSNSFKKTQKRVIEGGGITSILKKKGSIKNTKNITWNSSLPDGTPIIDNSFSDLSELDNTTNIDLSSISNDLEDSNFNLDLSNIQFIENNDTNQLGGEHSDNSEIINVNVDTNNSDSDYMNGDNQNIDISQHGGEQDSQSLVEDINSLSELNVNHNSSLIDSSSQSDLSILKENNIIHKNEDIIDLENKVNNELINTNNDNYSEILSSQSDLIGGSIDNFPNDSKLALEDTPSDVNDGCLSTMNDDNNDDNIMISIDGDNNVNILEKDSFINNDDIKIINLK